MQPPTTIRELLFWSYSNLAMAHVGVEDGALKYGRKHFMIRARLYKGLRAGTMQIRSLLDDERIKMNAEKRCVYCGADPPLSLDHLIPRSRGGPDRGDNVVWACRTCNSSKGATDVIHWHVERGSFPPLMIVRRYLKLAVEMAEERGVMDAGVDEEVQTPFLVEVVPQKFPAPGDLRL